MFKIVSTRRKGGRIELCTVPASWENKGKLRWPKKNGELLSRNLNNIPQPDWPIFNCTVKRRGFLSYNEAEEELTQMLKRTDTDYDTDLTDYNKDVQSNNNASTSVAVNDYNAMAQSMIDSGSTCTVTDRQLLEAHSINGHLFEVIAEGPLEENEGQPYTARVQSQDNAQSNLSNELLIIITQNQEKIMKKLAEISVQLAEVKENNRPYVCALAQAEGPQKQKFTIEPMNTVEELEHFDKQLSDPFIFENYLQKYSILCSVAEGNGYNCAYRLLDSLFSKKILCECSWTGGSRGPDVKMAFKRYKNIINFFFEMVHTWDYKYTIQNNEEFLKSVLRNALKRKDTKNIRKSSKKSKKAQKPKKNEEDKMNANDKVDEDKALDNSKSNPDSEAGPSTSNNNQYDIKNDYINPDIDEEEEDESLC